MDSAHVAVVAGRPGPLTAAIVRALADSHDVWWPDTGPPPARVDVLVHCADEYAAGPLAETPVATWQDLFEANVFDVARFTSLLLPALTDMLREEEERRGVRVAVLDPRWDDAEGAPPADEPAPVAAAVRVLVTLPRQARPIRLAVRPVTKLRWPPSRACARLGGR